MLLTNSGFVLALPIVQLTEYLRDLLTKAGVDADKFAVKFAEWKAAGPAGEYAFLEFGKDGYYWKPTRDGKYVLSHVHLIPVTDEEALRAWKLAFLRKKRKTSDTVLVYAADPTHGYLLIAVLREPTAHDIAKMLTDADKVLMNQFADVAAEFIFSGKVSI